MWPVKLWLLCGASSWCLLCQVLDEYIICFLNLCCVQYFPHRTDSIFRMKMEWLQIQTLPSFLGGNIVDFFSVLICRLPKHATSTGNNKISTKITNKRCVTNLTINFNVKAYQVVICCFLSIPRFTKPKWKRNTGTDKSKYKENAVS